MALAIFVALNVVIVSAMIFSAILWVRYLLATACGKAVHPTPLVDVVARRPPFWGPLDFVVMFCAMIVVSEALRHVFMTNGWMEPMPHDDAAHSVGPENPDQFASIAISILAGAFASAVAMTLLLLRRPNFSRCIRELGWAIDAKGVRQGLWGAIWYLPPIMLLSLAVSVIVPYHHPVMDALAAEPSISSFAVLAIGTVLVAPLVEEFMFRVLLQGGLQGAADPADADSFLNSQSMQWRPKQWWPIVMTSMFFASMHVGQGGAPIPLFFLSLSLGYLYRQTGSVIPSLVVHMVLNGTTMISEFTRLVAT